MRSFKVLFTLGLLFLGNLAARAADDNKPLKVYDDSTSRSHEILAIKVELTLALHL